MLTFALAHWSSVYSDGRWRFLEINEREEWVLSRGLVASVRPRCVSGMLDFEPSAHDENQEFLEPSVTGKAQTGGAAGSSEGWIAVLHALFSNYEWFEPGRFRVRAPQQCSQVEINGSLRGTPGVHLELN